MLADRPRARQAGAQLRLAALESAAAAAASSPPSFTSTLPASMMGYRHVAQLAAVLDRVAAGEITRLMVFMPPRHLKSTTVSRHFVAYWLRRFPTHRVVLASYAARLAQAHSRGAQALFTQRGGTLAEGQAEKSEWDTGDGGGLLAVGIGSGLTGHGGNLLVLDDSVKDAEEAASDAIAERNRDWYDSTYRTRAQGDDVQIIIETLWPGKASLAGYALEQEHGDRPDHWHIVVMDAIRDAEPYEFPPTCREEPDPRALGDVLCPAIKTREQLLAIKARSGYFFSSLYQQRRKVKDGKLFRWDSFNIASGPPNLADLLAVTRYWDMAGTEKRDDNDPDATSGTLMARHRNGSFWVLHRATTTADIGPRDAFIKQTADADLATYGRRCIQWFERQAGIGGEKAMQALTRLLAGHVVKSEAATGSKELRAEPLASQVQVGNVWLVKGDWTDPFRLQLCGFPFAAHDDDVDSASGAFNQVAGTAERVAITEFLLG